jgi:VIT1/CCC1 family predicted Fe2+/Mn2+ transporter
MIPEKDVRFVQQKAFELLNKGKGIDEVKELIAQEGGDENQIQNLSTKYVADFEFLIKDTKKRNKKSAVIYLNSGIVFFSGGFLASLFSYFTTDGHIFVWLWGLMLAGIVLFIKGINLSQ